MERLCYFFANAVEDPDGNIYLPLSEKEMSAIKDSDKELLKLYPLRIIKADGSISECSKAEEALHRIATSDIIKWDADTQEEYEREFMPWAKQIAKEALGLP